MYFSIAPSEPLPLLIQDDFFSHKQLNAFRIHSTHSAYMLSWCSPRQRNSLTPIAACAHPCTWYHFKSSIEQVQNICMLYIRLYKMLLIMYERSVCEHFQETLSYYCGAISLWRYWLTFIRLKKLFLFDYFYWFVIFFLVTFLHRIYVKYSVWETSMRNVIQYPDLDAFDLIFSWLNLQRWFNVT